MTDDAVTIDDRFAARVRRAVAIANLPTLIAVLVQLSGDWKWIHDPYAPSKPRGIDDNDDGGLPPDVQQEIRQAAADAIINCWTGGRTMAIPVPSAEEFVAILSAAMGERVPDEYGPMLAAEYTAAGLGAADDRRDRIFSHDLPPGFRVVIIGAGISGLTAAMRFAQAGIEFTVIEKANSVGGTWYTNRYPGSGVDTPSHLYSWPNMQWTWKKYFAHREEIADYVEAFADSAGLRDRIRFGTTVDRASWNAAHQCWDIEVRTKDGATSSLAADVLISAVGLFSKPVVPDWPGVGSLEIPHFHSADWPDYFSVDGKRVAVIGNGATSMQIVPAIAERAKKVFVYQRSPQWIAPFGKFGQLVPEEMGVLLDEFTLYRWWYRARLHWNFNDKLLPSLQKDPQWPHPERSLNRQNDRHREFLAKYIEEELSSRPDLVEMMTPHYPPYGKRILLDNGWYKAILRENVHLVTEKITGFAKDRVLLESGRSCEVDVVVFATGFGAVDFLSTVDLVGRSGRHLREIWGHENAEAYLGLLVPDFPNFFCMYGPNLQAGHGGSYFWTADAQVDFIMLVLDTMARENLGAIECTAEVCKRYNDRLVSAHEQMVWTHPGMSTYYRNSTGRVVVNFPYRNIDYWNLIRSLDPEDYLTERRRTGDIPVG
jgi:4-hydroxyacetophenone monooxygenase